MPLFTVDHECCKKDHACIRSCPAGLLTPDAEGFPVPTPEAETLCIDCGHCAAVCSTGALRLTRLPEADFTPAPPREAIDPAALGAMLKARRSIRAYKKTPVPHETLAELLDIARCAPTAVNSQHVAYIATEDPALVSRLAALCLEFLRPLPAMAHYVGLMDKGQDTMLRGAPHLVVAHVPADYLWGAVDSAIALTYLELAAHAKGLGCCWAGLLTRAAAHPPVREALGLPDGRAVHGALMLGWPQFPYRLIPPRKPLSVRWL